MKRSLSKGFTLVELIVVIAIIAILASVAIVGFQSYINRARVSNDVTDARNMTGVLQAYMTLNGLEDVDPAEIRSIVNLENDYSFIPRVEDYSFWYNEQTKTIEVKSSYEVMFDERDFTELTGGSLTRLLDDRASDEPGDKLEEVVEGFYLLDRGGSDFAEAINGIRNLKTLEDYNRIVDEDLDGFDTVKSHITTNFNLDDTLYINDFFGLTSSGNEDVTEVIFADGIEAIPGSALAGSIKELPDQIKIPVSVSVIERGAFASMESETKLEFDSSEHIQVEMNAFNPADTLNTDLIQKQGTLELEKLSFITKLSQEITRLYEIIPAGSGVSEKYKGRRIKTKDDPLTYIYYDDEGKESTDDDTFTDMFEDEDYLRVTTIERNIKLDFNPTLNGEKTGSLIYGVHVTYREDNGKVIAEAKAYDANGRLFAKGSTTTLRTISKVEYPTMATITFDWNYQVDSVDRGTYTTMTRIEGQTISAPTPPVRNGSDFGGWFMDSECTSGNEYSFDTMPAANVTLYAQWTEQGSGS